MLWGHPPVSPPLIRARFGWHHFRRQVGDVRIEMSLGEDLCSGNNGQGMCFPPTLQLKRTNILVPFNIRRHDAVGYVGIPTELALLARKYIRREILISRLWRQGP